MQEFIVALLVSNMAVTAVQMAIVVGVLGLISFILGVLAETKKVFLSLLLLKLLCYTSAYLCSCVYVHTVKKQVLVQIFSLFS